MFLSMPQNSGRPLHTVFGSITARSTFPKSAKHDAWYAT